MKTTVRKYFPEWGCILDCPRSMAEADFEEIMLVTNGCGRDGLEGRLVPDSIWWLDISPACRVHDWMYGEVESLQDERDADSLLAKNLISLIQQKTDNKFLLWLRLHRAYKYISAVVLTDCANE
jgi:hypothetical protein